MIKEFPIRAVVGGVEFNMLQTNALIDLFRHEGWPLLAQILSNHQKVTSDNLLLKPKQRTLQDLGIAQGAYGLADELLDLPRVAVDEYDRIRKSEESG